MTDFSRWVLFLAIAVAWLGAERMAKDPVLEAEIKAEARKKYVGKVADARAAAEYALNPEPPDTGGSSGPALAILVLIGLVAAGAWTNGKRADGDDRSVPPKVADATSPTQPSAVDPLVGRATGLSSIDGMSAQMLVEYSVKQAKSTCGSGSTCGFAASTTGPDQSASQPGIYRISYEPGADDDDFHGWKVFRSTAEQLNCDLLTAFGWTDSDDSVGIPPDASAVVYC